jgi:hypothetical protein
MRNTVAAFGSFAKTTVESTVNENSCLWLASMQCSLRTIDVKLYPMSWKFNNDVCTRAVTSRLYVGFIHKITRDFFQIELYCFVIAQWDGAHWTLS